MLGYQGKGFVSRLIRWQTRSKYSHVSIEIDGINYEAWQDGVIKRRWDEGHRPGTKVTVFEVKGHPVPALVLKALKAQLGKGYDYRAVARFLTRRKVQLDSRWFCAELVAWCLAYGGVVLQHLPPSYLSPRDVCMSPALEPVGTRKV